jgi:hypothetical protein
MVDDKGQVYLNGRRVSNRKLRDEVLQKASSDVAGDVDDSPTPQAKTVWIYLFLTPRLLIL